MNKKAVLVPFAIISVAAACESGTAPQNPLSGQYELRSIDGDTSVAKTDPDEFGVEYYGLIILRDDESYSYAVMTRVCESIFECTPMEVRTFGGTWSGTSSDIDLKENADGTRRHWHLSNLDLSGQEPKFFDGPRDLVFRKCADAHTFGCAFFPGA